MNNFVFENQTKVYFGKGAVAEHLEKILLNYGKNVMIGYGGGSIKKNGAYDDVMAALKATGKNVIEFSGIMPNPTLDYMRQGAKLARENNVDLIIAVGGGSTMDCCKAIAVQAVYDGDIWNDFYINPGNMDFDPVPFGVVVTMPATGSEVNGAGVLTNTEDMIKTDRDYVKMNPLFAVMDPMYTLTLPKRQMLAGAFDILSHIMETYVSFPIEDNVSDDVSETLMRGLIRDLRIATKNPMDYNARSNIMWESSMAENRIIKMGKSKDFECHNIEHQLTAYTGITHGEGLAVLHPAYYRHICEAGQGKFEKFAVNVWGLRPEDYPDRKALALAGIDKLADFIAEVGLPTKLTDLGITKDTDLRMIANTCYISQTAYRPLTHDEIYNIYMESL